MCEFTFTKHSHTHIRKKKKEGKIGPQQGGPKQTTLECPSKGAAAAASVRLRLAEPCESEWEEAALRLELIAF